MEDVKKTLELLSEISKLENTIAEFYTVCSQVFADTSDMWTTLSEEEKKHANYIKEIMQAVEKEPKKFNSNRKFTIETVRTVISGVQEDINEIKNKELSEKQALFVAKDIEYSNLEKNLCDIVSSDDPQYRSLIKKFADETRNQRQFLDSKIRQYALTH